MPAQVLYNVLMQHFLDPAICSYLFSSDAACNTDQVSIFSFVTLVILLYGKARSARSRVTSDRVMDKVFEALGSESHHVLMIV